MACKTNMNVKGREREREKNHRFSDSSARWLCGDGHGRSFIIVGPGLVRRLSRGFCRLAFAFNAVEWRPKNKLKKLKNKKAKKKWRKNDLVLRLSTASDRINEGYRGGGTEKKWRTSPSLVQKTLFVIHLKGWTRSHTSISLLSEDFRIHRLEKIFISTGFDGVFLLV